MSNDLIEKRNDRTRQRKAKKKRIDSLINLTYEDGQEENIISLSASVATISDTERVARLLDEGFCDKGFVIAKGTLEKYLNGENQYVTGWEMQDGSWNRTEVLNLTDDFTGTVNLAHRDFATHPFILGEFKKSDLALVDNENDRKGLDINVRLDEDSMYVKELRRQPYDIGVSAEFYYHIDSEATSKLHKEYGMYLPVIDEIFIFAYGLVGECGNVGSSGLELKAEGETTMSKEKKKELTVETTEEILEVETEETAEETETEELTADETAENEDETMELSDEAAEETETAEGEEVESEEAELVISDEAEDDEADGLEEVLSVVNQLKETVTQLTSKVESLEEANCKLKKTNKRLSAKLEDEKKKKEAFIENAKSVSVKLGVNEERPKKDKVADEKFAFGDGIGD